MKKPTAVPMENDYQAESDFGTMMRAHEIMGDKKRHSKAMAHGMKQKKMISSMKDLHDARKKLMEEKGEGENEPGMPSAKEEKKEGE